MKDKVHNQPDLIYSVGTEVVCLKPILLDSGNVLHQAGAVGTIIRAPVDRDHKYRIRLNDGSETSIEHNQLVLLAEYKMGMLNQFDQTVSDTNWYERVIYRCVVGSRAFGLSTEESDTDRRGIYLPTAEMHWSLFGIPEQLENEHTQEAYWELQKFLMMALKANPNILECLYTPLIEFQTPLATKLLANKDRFLSKLVYQTYNGYVSSQFKKMQADLENKGKRKPKHVMHLIRLLISGIHVLQNGFVMVDVGKFRDRLMAIKREEMPWEQVDRWRLDLHRQFETAYTKSTLPERPDYQWANRFLIETRKQAVEEQLP